MKTDDEFIEEYRPLVQSIATKVRNRFDLKADLDDLLADGYRGLLEAKARFDESRGVQFNTFAYYRIRGAIIDGVRKNAFLSRRAYRQLKAAEAALEIGEAAGEVRAADPKAKGDKKKTTEALHGTLAKLTASYVMASVGQDEHQPSETPEDAILKEEAKERVRALLSILPERELALVKGHYFDGRRFDEVAAELGISKSWASRLHGKALDRLREALAQE
ncbi:MAG TPA: sigma-70 family RNA polymerase sigma factor [Polyangiaceae bacterium LLY-WYZ-15_(1-7)]|nr:sigma-70 family RNA polymerase sigma factor [Polyangiaceae bacterium LLY-WYZ-15_(1-7)]HJL00026.1 sigma-70 family RNA polymerase sigma factor [Polyangiaceae bacterium LLY-WYZ-15_(1-7)]HJL12443.1 sigma-70 family RNA polymerase sigma factor [Polyangiaceae bacterium LLY-WYZ-15_(1-7)]HJL35210.1 sigma-70 family RNA polymerase sigma factor [Polyangiaceae bacterium LLY-WYZ-15_(1-7)]HJL45435.1 sigma-70 family RNA polymerase sigma factor [Polyangiaceae bacterium LLY-WYZ-15_(1-7)]